VSTDNDVLQLIFVTEKLHDAVRNGAALRPEEARLVRQCVVDLLEAISPSSQVTHPEPHH
jgi:hypothetical protein